MWGSGWWPFDTASSTRSKLCGFASLLLLIVAVARNWGLRYRCSSGWLRDSLSAISKAYKMNQCSCLASRKTFGSNLLSMIPPLLIEIQRIFHWVKGHQDSIRSYEQLPREVRLMINAAYLATRYRLQGKLKPMSNVDNHTAPQISISSIMGKRLTAQYDECIRFHINGYHLKQYMQERKKWDKDTWNMIDMGSFGQHFKQLTPSQQVSHMK